MVYRGRDRGTSSVLTKMQLHWLHWCLHGCDRQQCLVKKRAKGKVDVGVADTHPPPTSIGKLLMEVLAISKPDALFHYLKTNLCSPLLFLKCRTKHTVFNWCRARTTVSKICSKMRACELAYLEHQVPSAYFTDNILNVAQPGSIGWWVGWDFIGIYSWLSPSNLLGCASLLSYVKWAAIV